MQTRVFDGGDEEQILSASAAVLQDLGFTLVESNPDLGLLVAAKDRTALERKQVARAILMNLVFSHSPAIDIAQKFRATLVTRSSGEKKTKMAVRITFQRTVKNDKGVEKSENINDPELYQEFFEMLSKSIFLEAQKI